MSTSARISEIFSSLQGEGPSAGTPALFLRFQGCTVGCRWCDTKYAWDETAGAETTSDELWRRAHSLGNAALLVVTGGEPLERPSLSAWLEEALERWPRVEVETSGLLPPPLSHPRLAYNVSPKLPSATPRWAETWSSSARWVEEPRATFKIVVGDAPDPEDAIRLIDEHRLPRERVMLMPEGTTEEQVRKHAVELAEICKREGFRMSPRLHIWMWGARRGV